MQVIAGNMDAIFGGGVVEGRGFWRLEVCMW